MIEIALRGITRQDSRHASGTHPGLTSMADTCSVSSALIVFEIALPADTSNAISKKMEGGNQAASAAPHKPSPGSFSPSIRVADILTDGGGGRDRERVCE
jgi:hypothetical protein